MGNGGEDGFLNLILVQNSGNLTQHPPLSPVPELAPSTSCSPFLPTALLLHPVSHTHCLGLPLVSWPQLGPQATASRAQALAQGPFPKPGASAGRGTRALEPPAALTQLVGQGQGVGGVLHGAAGRRVRRSPSLLLFQRGGRQVAKLPRGVGGAPALVPAHAAASVQAGDLAEVCKAKGHQLSGDTEPLPLAEELVQAPWCPRGLPIAQPRPPCTPLPSTWGIRDLP